METPIDIVLQDSARHPTTGVLHYTPLGFDGRLGRALKALGILWLVALGCVPLPGLHFVLTPGFFVAGIVAAILRFQAKVVVDDTSIKCPKCDRDIAIEKGTTGWPARVLCNECSSRLVMSPHH